MDVKIKYNGNVTNVKVRSVNYGERNEAVRNSYHKNGSSVDMTLFQEHLMAKAVIEPKELGNITKIRSLSVEDATILWEAVQKENSFLSKYDKDRELQTGVDNRRRD